MKIALLVTQASYHQRTAPRLINSDELSQLRQKWLLELLYLINPLLLLLLFEAFALFPAAPIKTCYVWSSSSLSIAIQINRIVQKYKLVPSIVFTACRSYRQTRKERKTHAVCMISVFCIVSCYYNGDLWCWVGVSSSACQVFGRKGRKLQFSGMKNSMPAHSVFHDMFTFKNCSCQSFNCLRPCCIIHSMSNVLYCTVLTHATTDLYSHYYTLLYCTRTVL